MTVIDLDAEEEEDNNNIELEALPTQEFLVDSTTHQLEELKARHRYRIIVTAFTSAGEGEENFVEETATVLVAPDPPTVILL